MTLSRLLLSVAIVSTLAGCESGGSLGTARLRVDVRATPATLAAGDTLRPTLVVRNTASGAVSYSGNGCLYGIEVRRVADGEVVYPGHVACQQLLITETLRAGEAREVAFRIVVPSAWTAGAYEVRGVVRASDGHLLSAPERVTVTASR